VDELELAYQTQVAQTQTAGYFSGYSAKTQPVGRTEMLRSSQALERDASAAEQVPEAKAIRDAAKRMVRDLESKGVLRTTVETTNLAVHDHDFDNLAAECIRTVSSVDFPALMLLKREEAERGAPGTDALSTPVTAAGAPFRRRAYLQAPFDLMYGYRGTDARVYYLSPFEMQMHWMLVHRAT